MRNCKNEELKMRKKLASLMFCLITMFTCLSGCSIFVLDQDKYLNEVVVKTDNIEITREQLLVMYNNYAPNLINSGFSKQQAVDYCLNSLINTAIISQKGEKELTLTDVQMHKAVQETISYFNSLVANYEEKVRAEWNVQSTIPKEQDAKATYTNYEKQAVLEFDSDNNCYVIRAIEKPSDVVANQEYVQLFKDYKEGKDVDLYSQFKKQWQPEFEDVGNEALKRIAIEYRSQFKSYKTLKDAEVLEKALEKQFKNVVQNAYISALDEKYKNSIASTINTNMVMEEYNRIISDNKAKFDLSGGVGYKNYINTILEKADNVYYHPVENEFFYVSHVLLEFSEEQKAQIEAKKKLKNEGAMTQIEYDTFLADLAKEIKVKAVDENGQVTENEFTAEQIYSEISNAVSTKGVKEFNQFVYKYNSDPGIQNKNRDYVIGVDKGDDITRSKMVEPFTNASRELYEQGDVGALSGLVLTDYGYHIIQYTGKVENIVVPADENLSYADELCVKLDSVNTALHSDKTVFDEVVESLIKSNDKSNAINTLYITEFKANHEVIKYVDRYSELLK